VVDMKNMTCQELVELVSAFLDGELDPTTERRLVDHVAICDGCGNYIDQFRQTISTLAELPDEAQGVLSPERRGTLLAEFRKLHPPADDDTDGVGNQPG
jgi:predicted anti-sigma-YlaC factor YlaD